jgi:hypothetical protein
MEVGRHKVKVTGAFVGAGDKTPYIGIEFTNELNQSIVDRLYLTDTVIGGSGTNAGKKVKTVSIEKLVKCGFIGRDLDALDNYDSIDDVFKSVNGGIEITVFDEEYTDNAGEVKTSRKVKYINFGFESKEQKMDRAEIKKVSTRFSLAGDIARMAKEMQGNYVEPKQETFNSDDIPF